MELLKSETEGLIIFFGIIVYFIVLSFLQAKHLKYLKMLSKNDQLQNVEAKRKLRSLKWLTPLVILICPLLLFSIASFMNEEIRVIYLIPIFIEYFIFTLIMYINYILKGRSILNGLGDSGALPG